jgi:hypothetical protein
LHATSLSPPENHVAWHGLLLRMRACVLRRFDQRGVVLLAVAVAGASCVCAPAAAVKLDGERYVRARRATSLHIVAPPELLGTTVRIVGCPRLALPLLETPLL